MMDNVKTVGVPFMGTQNMHNINSVRASLVGAQNDTHNKDYHKGLPLREYRRRSIRLKHYDYSQVGYYFVTIVTQNREHLFGEIVDGEMILNVAGKMIHTLWYEITNDFSNMCLHEFVIMPNHIHGIIEIVDDENISKPVGVPLVGTLNVNTNPKMERMSRSHRISNKGQPQGIAPTSISSSFDSFETL